MLFREEAEERDFRQQVIHRRHLIYHEHTHHHNLSGKVSKLVAETCLKKPQFKLAIDPKRFRVFINH